MIAGIDDPRIQKILTLPTTTDTDWKKDLQRLQQGDITLDRKTVGENSVIALQRLLIFLGFSTTGRGSFKIDGDFGRGTNRGLAQFKFENGLGGNITRRILCYNCSWRDAHKKIVSVPDSRLDIPTLEKFGKVTLAAIDSGNVMCGSFDEALYHLNNVHQNKFYTSRQILDRYGAMAKSAATKIKAENGATLAPEWILTIIKQETAGVVRPRFEQHLLTRFNRDNSGLPLDELRYRAMSFGLGQILGVNYKMVKATSAKAMFTSPLPEQVLFVARFLTYSSHRRGLVAKKNPSAQDFRGVAKFYNGSGYEAHHYHESIERWYKEFRSMM